jgi:hypothetical protein
MDGNRGKKKRESKANKSAQKQEKLCVLVIKKIWNWIWFREMTPEARFAGWVARFTFVLCVVGGFQGWFFIESERAFLVFNDAHFIYGEPNNLPHGLDMAVTLKNVGKHTATDAKFKFKLAVFVIQKQLDPVPQYHDFNVTVAPIVPDERRTINLLRGSHYTNETKGHELLPHDQVVNGIIDGSIPIRVWGFVEYSEGYFGMRGSSAFCFEFVAKKNRVLGQRFKTCKNAAYTYAH